MTPKSRLFVSFIFIAVLCTALIPNSFDRMPDRGRKSEERDVSRQSQPALRQTTSPAPVLSNEKLKPIVNSILGNLPLSFEANHGQTDGRVKFVSRGNGYTLFLTADQAVLEMHAQSGKRKAQGNTAEAAGAVVKMKLVGANQNPEMLGENELPGKSNYFLGNDPAKWRTNVPNYSKIRYRDVYPGVDLVYYGNRQQLEYDLLVAPGADPKAIRFAAKGAEKLELNAEGGLVLHVGGDQIVFQKPVVYQEVSGRRRYIGGGYVLRGKNEVGFEIGSYNRNETLTIDPTLSLVYSTYLGGSNQENGDSVAVDTSGNIYVTGWAFSTDFPTTPGSYQPTWPGARLNAFVAKIKPTASGSASLVYSTYLGSDEPGTNNGAVGIAVDGSGNAYVTGATNSTNFPTTSGALQTNYGGGPLGYGDAFVTKLNAAGNGLLYSTYLGGSGDDWAQGITIDSSGNAYVTGNTDSIDFPTTSGAFQTTYGGGFWNAFVSKLNPTAFGSASLVYSTYLGGTGYYGGLGQGIAVGPSGSVYVVGTTDATNFPTTSSAFQTTFQGSVQDIYVTELNPSLSGPSSLVYSTYLGGSSKNDGNGIAVDFSGNIYVAGDTESSDFPTTPSAFQTAIGGGSNAIVAKLNPSAYGAASLLYSTYLGGNSDGDTATAIAVDSSGNAYVIGDADSANFPTTPGALQTTYTGSGDVFVSKLNPAASGAASLVYSTYLGGSGYVQVAAADGIAVDGFGNVYVTGLTNSTDFPTTSTAFQTTLPGSVQSGFVTEISNSPILTPQTWTATGSMNVPRAPYGQVALLNNGEVLVEGGCVPDLSSAELYDPATGAFSLTGSMTTPRCGSPATLLQNGKVLITGGCSHADQTSISSAELYDPATGTFTATGSMTTPRSNHTATLLANGQVLITGGLSDCYFSGTVISGAELYDPTTGTFSPTGSMSFASWQQTATLLGNGEVLVAGGASTGCCFSNADLYDPNAGTFTPTGSMTTGREYDTATLLTSGQVLVAGGANNGNLLSSSELYDPATGDFTLTGSMTTARYVHTATPLNNGTVLIAGGNGPSGVLASAELYDPTTGDFTATASMITARATHGAALLGNGTVLAAGGSNSSGFLSSAEIYQPSGAPALIAPTITFTGAPATAAYQSTFNVSATTNASTTAVITATGACMISEDTVTMTSGTGTCNLLATWAADSTYMSASATQSTTAQQETPAVTFTGAPGSAVYQSTFNVSATTNASTTAVITATGACMISGNTVTMTSGTGTCNLLATWAADSNYLAASATQSTSAMKAAPVITWASPAAITLGTALNGTQLNATANVAGNFVYSPAAGTVLPAGTTNLSVTFTPNNNADYSTATASVPITVNDTGNLTISTGQSYTFTNGKINGNVTVTGGTLILNNSSVGGNITMSGGSLILEGASTVGGNVTITGGIFAIGSGKISGNLTIQNIPASAAQNQICGETVNGGLTFQNNGTAVQIGSSSCAGNTIAGNLQVTNNSASVQVDNNKVSGNIQIQNNTAAAAIFTNTAKGNLSCSGNTASLLTGGGNTAATKQGQCADF